MGAAAAAVAGGACQRQQQQGSSSSSSGCARDPQLRARGVRVLSAYVRAHAAIGTSAQPSSPRACRLTA
eukprot:2878807-Prymnesium_polylepis.1